MKTCILVSAGEGVKRREVVDGDGGLEVRNSGNVSTEKNMLRLLRGRE